MALKAISTYLFLKSIDAVSQLWYIFTTANKNLSPDASVCFLLFFLKHEAEIKICKSSHMI